MPDVHAVTAFFASAPPAPVQKLESGFLKQHNITVYIKREDLLHPEVSGNKWRKLKYNLIEAAKQQKNTVLTFGGAFSNHIAAVAAAGKALGFKTVGFIRGEEHFPLNPTLQKAAEQGMQLYYLNRETYRLKNSAAFLEKLQLDFPDAFILPEGGTNALAVKGCAEIIQEITVPYNVICVAAGTGGTAAGLLSGLNGEGKLLVFSALKGEFLKAEIDNFTKAYNGKSYTNWQLQTGFHFGGYARVKPELLQFISGFQVQYQIALEPVYTGKMLFGIFELLKQSYFKPGTSILAVHTGGLQGNAGFRKA